MFKKKKRSGCPLSAILLNPIQRALANAVRQEKKIEGMNIETELKYVTIYKDTSVYSQTLRAFIQRSL